MAGFALRHPRTYSTLRVTVGPLIFHERIGVPLCVCLDGMPKPYGSGCDYEIDDGFARATPVDLLPRGLA